MSESTNKMPYGKGDSSYIAAGEEAGIRQLTSDFYAAMQELPQAKKILDMHPKDLDTSANKLALFLCAYLGGPKLFEKPSDNVPLPISHKHLAIGPNERDAWMDCMRAAVAKQDWQEDFKAYYLEQIYKPTRILRNRDS